MSKNTVSKLLVDAGKVCAEYWASLDVAAAVVLVVSARRVPSTTST